jgi:tripartite-type tricarboxylate transporter receptor subunit TctC
VFKLFKSAFYAHAAIAVIASPVVLAQSYPSKPITAVVFGPPGSTPDLFARAITKQMSVALGQPFVIDNRPGSSGFVATNEVIRAAPDGYTVLFTSSTSLVNVMHLMKKPPFDSMRDLTPIGATFTPVEVVVARADLPAKTLPELITYGKRNPDKLSFGAAGVGSIFHLNGELFASTAGIKMTYVPYKGPLAALQDVAGGNVDMAFNSFGGLEGMLATGKMRVIATLEKQRYKGMPDVPTVAEILPSYQKVDSWFAMMAPAKVPRPIVERLNTELVKALKSPELVKWMDSAVVQPIGGSPDQVTQMMKDSSARVKKLIDQVGLQPE